MALSSSLSFLLMGKNINILAFYHCSVLAFYHWGYWNVIIDRLYLFKRSPSVPTTSLWGIWHVWDSRYLKFVLWALCSSHELKLAAVLVFFCESTPPTIIPVPESQYLGFLKREVPWERENISLLQNPNLFYAWLVCNFVSITIKCFYCLQPLISHCR